MDAFIESLIHEKYKFIKMGALKIPNPMRLQYMKETRQTRKARRNQRERRNLITKVRKPQIH